MLAQSPWVKSWPLPVKVGWVMGGGCSVRVAIVLGGVMMTMGLRMMSLCLRDCKGVQDLRKLQWCLGSVGELVEGSAHNLKRDVRLGQLLDDGCWWLRASILEPVSLVAVPV